MKRFVPIDQSRYFIPAIFHYNWATLEYFPGNMPPTQLLSSSPPPQPAKSSDNKVVVDNTTAKQSLLQNQSRDQVNAISFAPKEPDATEPAAQATRPPSGNRGASSRGTKVKSSATGKAPLVQSGQSQLTRLGFHASSSSPPRATSVTPAPMTRGPGYYSAEGPRTRPPESPQKQSSPQTPKKRVHFFESPNKKGNDNYYTPKQRDGPALRAPNSPGTPMQTSSSAPRTISSPKTPRSAVRKQFEKLVMNMDEVQLYITYSRAFKEVEAKMANNPPKKVKVTIPSVLS